MALLVFVPYGHRFAVRAVQQNPPVFRFERLPRRLQRKAIVLRDGLEQSPVVAISRVTAAQVPRRQRPLAH